MTAATPESYCAQQIVAREDELFLAVGDKVALLLNPRFEEDRRTGRSESLPDLLSVRHDGPVARYRLREVKFKLEGAIVRKAVDQLASGAALLAEYDGGLPVDRLEIVVPLRQRKLKASETAFLGDDLGGGRYALRLDGAPATVGAARHPVTVLIL